MAIPTRRQYPHVDGVTDWQARQTLRLLWDRYFNVQEGLNTANATITSQAATISSLRSRLTTAESRIAELRLQAQQAVTTPTPDLTDPPTSGSFPTGPTAINFPGLGIVQVYSSPDVSGWAQTGTLTRLGFDPGLLSVSYTTMAAWSAQPVNIGGAFQAATLWLFFNIGGTWYGAGAERFRPNQATKVEATNYSQWPGDFWYNATNWGPLAGLVPTPGQQAAALMTAGSTRLDNTTYLQERTDLVTFAWPADGTSTFFP